MPPLSIEMKLGEQIVTLPDILPGVPASLTDVDATKPSIVVISCNPEDNGGIVYRQKPEDTQEVFNRAGRIVSADMGDIEAVIGPDGAVDLPIATKFGKATLTIRHY